METKHKSGLVNVTCGGLCCTKIRDIQVTRGKTTILHDVNLHIHCGELTALIGPNGAGKSTLLKAILGEIPHQGKVDFVSAAGNIARNPVIGYVPQHLEFDIGSPISVLDLFFASKTGSPVWLFNSHKLRLQVLESLGRAKAEHLIDKRLGNLSGGELQRVLLALALEPVPDLLLLDEPVSGVDFKGIGLFYEMVSDLRRQFDLSIILISHDLGHVAKYADRIVFLNKTIQCEGSPEEVFRNDKFIETFGYVNI
ncbi:metal ABC transporter ATP-binding protein [Bacillota bacterium LX-D]|nr:metal ABC transporter ATP-binding protein [Bacillota bacterium LX-D]